MGAAFIYFDFFIPNHKMKSDDVLAWNKTPTPVLLKCGVAHRFSERLT